MKWQTVPGILLLCLYYFYLYKFVFNIPLKLNKSWEWYQPRQLTRNFCAIPTLIHTLNIPYIHDNNSQNTLEQRNIRNPLEHNTQGKKENPLPLLTHSSFKIRSKTRSNSSYREGVSRKTPATFITRVIYSLHYWKFQTLSPVEGAPKSTYWVTPREGIDTIPCQAGLCCDCTILCASTSCSGDR